MDGSDRVTIDLTGGLDLAWENVFTAQPDHPEMHESINAWIWDDSGSIGLPRIGVEAIGNSWETHGLQVNIVTTAKSAEVGKRLLELMGFPFRRTA